MTRIDPIHESRKEPEATPTVRCPIAQRSAPMRPEQPHPEEPLEWWFLQGWFEGPDVARQFFMLAFFEERRRLPDQSMAVGHMLLISHLNPHTGQHAYRSQICPETITMFLDSLDDHRKHNLDPAMVTLLADEIRRFGPPRPVRKENAPVQMAKDRLQCNWADMTLRQTAHRLHCAYESPVDGNVVHLTAAPRSPRFFQAADPPRNIPMAYAAIPRLDLQGTVSGRLVAGAAWFDHQWGDDGLFRTRLKDQRVLGWQWFGINLDDGTDLFLAIRRDMQDHSVIGRYAYACNARSAPMVLSDFRASATRIWESGATRCRYPLDWTLEIPELEMSLTVTPMADDQEIRLFGAMRTVWEGACKVTGACRGRPITGHARLELFGYGFIHNFSSYLDRWVRRIDGLIEEFLPPVLDRPVFERLLGDAQDYDFDAQTVMLSQPVWDMLQRGGKRWRPIFGALLLEALGRSYMPFEKLLAVTIELMHLGSLIIDDIEDQSLLRRSQPTIHRRYGVDLAINAGNTLYMLPLLLLEDHPELNATQREQIYQVVVRQYVRSHIGQSMDIYWSKFMAADRLDQWLAHGFDRKVLKMYADKTGASVVGLAHIACIIAGAEKETRQRCASFAGAFGVAFQILDDVLNFSRSKNWTKTVGEDLAHGKPTYVIIQALKHARGDAAILLRRLLCDAACRRDLRQLEKGIEIVVQSEVLEQCRQEAQDMVRHEWEQVAEVLRPGEGKTMLRMLCANLTDLTFVS